MKEDLHPKLYKFLICKLGLDSLRNSTSKMDIFPWLFDTNPTYIPNIKNPWKWSPNLVQQKSCGRITISSSPYQVYFDRRDRALKKSEKFASAKLPYAFEFPFRNNENIYYNNSNNTNNSFTTHELLDDKKSSKGHFVECQSSTHPCLLELKFPSFKDIIQSSATSTSPSDEVSNEDEDEYWKTYNLMTPRGGGVATTIFWDQGKEVTIELDDHNKLGNQEIRTQDTSEESFKDIEMTENYEPSVDGLCVEDVEGEDIIDKLRRQVEFDKKTIIKMYEEIDNERNAAAEAASQAMAMITKLHEEKASIDLDALQCQRMMEEDAKQDSIALQEAYQLLAQKDKHLQDLEAELEFYKSNYPCD